MSFLREVVGVEEIRLRKMVVLLPALFSYSVQTMQAKVDFFTEELHMDEDVRMNNCCYTPARLVWHAGGSPPSNRAAHAVSNRPPDRRRGLVAAQDTPLTCEIWIE